MSKAAKNRAAKKRITKKGKKNTFRNKQRKQYKHLGWPSKGTAVMPPELDEDVLKAKVLASIDEEIEAADTMKALKVIAREAGVTSLREFKVADRDKLVQCIRMRVVTAWEKKMAEPEPPAEPVTEDPS